MFYISLYPLYPFFINTHFIYFLSSNISKNQKSSKAWPCLAFLFPLYSAETSSVSIYIYCLLCLQPCASVMRRAWLHLLHSLPAGRVASVNPSEAFPAPGWPSSAPVASPPRASAPALTASGTSMTSPQFVDVVSRYDLTSAEQKGLIPPSQSPGHAPVHATHDAAALGAARALWAPLHLLPPGPRDFPAELLPARQVQPR